MKIHNIELPEPLELIRKINQEIKNVKIQMRGRGLKFERVKAMSLYEFRCKEYISCINRFACDVLDKIS